MINLQFTGNMSVCFIEFAKVLRLDFIPVADWIREWTDVGQAGIPLNSLMKMNGFEANSVLLNVGQYVFLFGLLLLT